MEETRKKILEAAERLIIEYGWENVTIRMITSEAGVNLAAINYHFGSREELEDALLQKIIDPLHNRMIGLLQQTENRAFPNPPTVETIIRCFLEPLIEFGQNYPNHHKLIKSLFSGIKNKHKIISYVKTSIHTLNSHFIKTLKKSLPEVSEEKIKFYYAILFASSNLLCHDSTFTEIVGISITKEMFLEEMITLFSTALHIEKEKNKKKEKINE